MPTTPLSVLVAVSSEATTDWSHIDLCCYKLRRELISMGDNEIGGGMEGKEM